MAMEIRASVRTLDATSGRGSAPAGVRPAVAQANPFVPQVGVFVYGPPSGTDYLVVKMCGGGSYGGFYDSPDSATAGFGGNSGAAIDCKITGAYAQSTTVLAGVVGAGGDSTGGHGGLDSLVQVDIDNLIRAQGAVWVWDTAPVATVTGMAGTTTTQSNKGVQGAAHSGDVGGKGAATGGTVFVSIGGAGGALGKNGSPGVLGGGGGGGGNKSGATIPVAGLGGDGRVVISAYRADGSLV